MRNRLFAGIVLTTLVAAISLAAQSSGSAQAQPIPRAPDGKPRRITRLIPLDGRPHQQGIEPTYYGDPVGHWEGDTLVIDSTNYKRWSLDDYYYTDPKQYRMHTEAFHTIERLRRVDTNTISYQFTVDDRNIFSAPWSEDFEMKLHPEWNATGLYEFVCEENNRCPGGQCRK